LRKKIRDSSTCFAGPKGVAYKKHLEKRTNQGKSSMGIRKRVYPIDILKKFYMSYKESSLLPPVKISKKRRRVDKRPFEKRNYFIRRKEKISHTSRGRKGLGNTSGPRR